MLRTTEWELSGTPINWGGPSGGGRADENCD